LINEARRPAAEAFQQPPVTNVRPHDGFAGPFLRLSIISEQLIEQCRLWLHLRWPLAPPRSSSRDKARARGFCSGLASLYCLPRCFFTAHYLSEPAGFSTTPAFRPLLSAIANYLTGQRQVTTASAFQRLSSAIMRRAPSWTSRAATTSASSSQPRIPPWKVSQKVSWLDHISRPMAGPTPLSPCLR